MVDAGNAVVTAVIGAIILGGAYLMYLVFGFVGAAFLLLFLSPIYLLLLRVHGGSGEVQQRRSKGAHEGGEQR